MAYTSVVNADTTTVFVAEDHRATESDILGSRLSHTFLRNSFYTENYLAQVPGYRQRGEIVSAAGDGKISAALRADFADAAAAALVGGHEGKTYELGGPAFTMAELADAVTAASRATVRHRSIPIHALRTRLLRSGVDPGFVPVLLQIDQCVAQGALFTDSGDLTELLGRQRVCCTGRGHRIWLGRESWLEGCSSWLAGIPRSSRKT